MAKGISFHIGLNRVDPGHYNGWSGPLVACEYDAEDLREIAVNIGYETTVLSTEAATRDAVQAAIRKAADTLSSGDIFLLTYSGHGGQVPDRNGDERDLADETWCLYDGELIDDEINYLWTSFAEGVRIVVLSDSCHSGTVTRMRDLSISIPDSYMAAIEGRPDGAHAYRMMPVGVARDTYIANKDLYDQIQRDLPPSEEWHPIKARVRLLSGCQDNQLSMDGAFNGAFTGTLKRVFADGGFQGDYESFHREIVRLMPPTQTPNHFILGGANPAFDAEKPFQIQPGGS
jgi:hypothetical protein